MDLPGQPLSLQGNGEEERYSHHEGISLGIKLDVNVKFVLSIQITISKTFILHLEKRMTLSDNSVSIEIKPPIHGC